MISKERLKNYLDKCRPVAAGGANPLDVDLCWECHKQIDLRGPFVSICQYNVDILFVFKNPDASETQEDIIINFHTECFKRLSGDEYSFEKVMEL